MKAPKVKAFIVKVASHDHWALPTDAESYERMVEQVRRKICLAQRVFPKAVTGWTNGLEYRADARAALGAIGITAPKKGTNHAN